MSEFDKAPPKQVSRRKLLKGAVAGAAGVTLAQANMFRTAVAASMTGGRLAQAGLFHEVAAMSESVQDILNITTTIEQFGVTFLGAGIASAEQKNYNKPWPAPVLAIVKAARAQEQFHLDFFERAGGKSLVSTFTIPPVLLTDFNSFFKAIVVEEALEIATQLAAIRTYAELKRPDLVKISFQYAAEEAEHRVLANYTLGTRPANDVAFAPMLLGSISAMMASFRKRGLIGGMGKAIPFPGPGRIDSTNVINRTPDGPAA